MENETSDKITFSEQEIRIIKDNFNSFMKCWGEPEKKEIKEWLKKHEIEFLRKRVGELEKEKLYSITPIIIERKNTAVPFPTNVDPWFDTLMGPIVIRRKY